MSQLEKNKKRNGSLYILHKKSQQHLLVATAPKLQLEVFYVATIIATDLL